MRRCAIVTSPEQIIGGQTFICVNCLYGELTIYKLATIKGKPHIDNFVKSWFVGCRGHGEFSLRDCNVIPNSYSDHSLWRFNTKTLNYLESLAYKGEAGVKEYLSILAHYKRGETYNKK